MKALRLSPEQWKLLSGAFSNMGQAIILFSLAAFFVPETVGLSQDFSRDFSIGFLLSGLILLAAAVIIIKRGK